jgi:hypothetical protein
MDILEPARRRLEEVLKRSVKARVIPNGHQGPDPETQRAIRILEEDFSEADSIGPTRVAQFLYERPDEDLRADVAGLVRGLLAAVRAA